MFIKENSKISFVWKGNGVLLGMPNLLTYIPNTNNVHRRHHGIREFGFLS